MGEPLLRLDEDVMEALGREARLTQTPEAAIASRAIRDFLGYQEWKRGLLAERRAEADKGEFVSEEAMTRWVDSWGAADELPPPEPDVFTKPRL